MRSFWAGPAKYKRNDQRENLTGTEFATQQGLDISGSPKWPGLIEAQVGDEIIDPLYRTEFIAHDSKLDRIDWPLGAIKFPCVILRPTTSFLTTACQHIALRPIAHCSVHSRPRLGRNYLLYSDSLRRPVCGR